MPLVVAGGGCSARAGATVLGAAPPPAGARAVAVRDLNGEAAASGGKKSVIVRGAMIEKCPAAGCWFKLRDATGVVRVDTKNAGFVVTDVPVGAILTVAGTPAAPAAPAAAGTEPTLAATGLRY